jgi:hypothetical protein
MRSILYHRAPGQSLVVVALFMGLIFAFMGLAIDGGTLYMQRRLMQNTADAACLAAANQLSIGQSDSAAQSRAEAIIAENLGPSGPGTGANAPGTLSYTNIADTYAANGTTEAQLTRGIEINGASIRVAISSPATTFFLRVIGISDYTVMARARCGSSAGGGVNPFIVARWRGFKQNGDMISGGPSTDIALPQTYAQGRNNPNMIVRDLLQRENQSAISQWPDWGSNGYPGDPDAGTALYSSPAAGVVATVANPGPETTIAGNDANSNLPSNRGFSGPVVLDFRNVTFPQPLLYNGLSAGQSLQTNTDDIGRYILGNYPGPAVLPGQQLAFFSGVGTAHTVAPFNLRYDVGQIVTTLVYNGTMYDTTQSYTAAFANTTAARRIRDREAFDDDDLSDCSVDSTNFDGTAANQETRKAPANYLIQVTPQVFSRYTMRALLSTDAVTWGELQGSWNGGGYANFPLITSASSSINPGGGTIQLAVQPSTSSDCVLTDPSSTITSTVTLPTRANGAQTIYVELQDQATSRRRATYAFLNMNSDADDFYAYVPGQLLHQPMQPGDTISVEFMLETVGNSSPIFTSGNGSASVGTIEWYAPDNLSSAIGSGATYNGVQASISTIGNGSNRKTMLNLNIANNAITGREYYLKIPFTYTKGGETYRHYLWYYVQVRARLNNSQSVNDFVYALGYANFQITYIDTNTIRGRAVSGLLRPEQLTMGMQPRLLPWN